MNIRFLVESSLNNKNLKLSVEWFSRKSTLTEKHFNRIEILEKIFEESESDKQSRSFLISRQSSRWSTSEYHERSKNSYLNHESFRHTRQNRRTRFDESLNVKSDKYREKFYHHQFKYQNSSKMIKYSFELFTRYFSKSIQQRQNFRHKQIVNFDHYDDFQRNFRQRFYDANSTFVLRENRKLQFVNLTHDYDYESRFFQKNFRNFEFIKSVRFRSSDVMIFNSKKHFAIFFIRSFQHIAKLEKQKSIFRVLLMCFVEIALKWHNSLFSMIRQKMNSNLRTWENELLRKFRSNKFVSFKKTKKLIFRFQESLILSQYLSRKINFLHDAEIRDEDIMINYLWKELKSNLAFVISMRKDEDILKNFERRIRMNEIAAFKIHDLINKIKSRKKFDIVKSRKSRFDDRQKFEYQNDNRIEYQSDNRSAIFAERAKKFIKKLFTIINNPFQNTNALKFFKKKVVKSRTKRVKKTSSRSCRICEESHWDNDFSNKSTNEKKVLFINVKDEHSFVSFLNDDDLQNLKNVIFDRESKNWWNHRRSTMTMR